MVRIPFFKVESIGNDFVLVHESELEDAKTEFLSELAIQSSNRHTGVGSDGLLVLAGMGDFLRLRMFNPDGSEDFCGNGLRCAALHAHLQGWVGNEFAIRHLEREVPTHMRSDGKIAMEIGSASYDSQLIPAHFSIAPEKTCDRPIWNGHGMNILGSALTTGSTHVVLFAPALPSDELFFLASPQIEQDPQFPDRTSVIWAKELAPMKIQIRIWERGAGETMGCGTGSSAAAVEYMRRHQTGGTVEVKNPGGSVCISAASWDAPITILGQAREVYSGQFLMR